jgi:hypothetical protein
MVALQCWRLWLKVVTNILSLLITLGWNSAAHATLPFTLHAWFV